MRDQHGDRAARDPRPDAVRTAGQNNRNTSAEHQPSAVRIGQETELLRQHVSSFEIGDEQNVRVAGNIGLDSFNLRRLLADGVVEGKRTVKNAALDLSTVRLPSTTPSASRRRR